MGQIIAGGEQFETHIEADHRGRIIQKGPDSGMFDAFARQRFSQPFTLFESIMRHSKRTDLWDEQLTASGTVNFLSNEGNEAWSTDSIRCPLPNNVTRLCANH